MLGGDAPFPDSDLHGDGTTSEPMLPGKNTFQRFGHTGVYRDAPFAVAFVVQLLAVLAIAIANGYSVLHHGPPEPHHKEDEHIAQEERSHAMLVMLIVAAIVSACLAAVWLAALRSGARVLIWAGAGGGVVLALANGIWLLSQASCIARERMRSAARARHAQGGRRMRGVPMRGVPTPPCPLPA
jgi:hypothetical protein